MGLPRLAHLDPMTGEVIRASKVTAVRYERDKPGSWCTWMSRSWAGSPTVAAGRPWDATRSTADRDNGPGYDYVHSLVDDHSRFAYCEVLPDETGPTCAAFLERAIDYFAARGITDIEQLITDNAWAYKWSYARCAPPTTSDSLFIKPHCPPGRTARLSASTEPCSSSGPTASVLNHNDETHRRPCPMARALQH
jgi:hypothetical protein